MPEANQLSLPYKMIDKSATRVILRKRKELLRGNKESWLIPIKLIEERPGFMPFGSRYSPEEIEALSESIFSVGLQEPIYVDVLENGKIYVEKGHNRLTSIKLLRKNKKVRTLPNGETDDFSLVECFINKSNMTEEQRIINIYGSNMHSKELRPLEQAEVARRLKFCLGKERSNEEVGKMLGVSRQSIDNMMLIITQPDKIIKQISEGELSFRAAVDLIREQKKALKIKTDDSQEDASHQTSMYKTAPKDNLSKEIKEMEQEDEDEEEQDEEPPFTNRPKGLISLITKSAGITYAGLPKEKGVVKYDEKRPEIKAVQNAIGLSDKIAARVDKLAISDGDKKDIFDWVQWLQKDLMEARTFIHTHKQENKIR